MFTGKQADGRRRGLRHLPASAELWRAVRGAGRDGGGRLAVRRHPVPPVPEAARVAARVRVAVAAQLPVHGQSAAAAAALGAPQQRKQNKRLNQKRSAGATCGRCAFGLS